ncbi:MAG: hypothetical protein ABIJ50_06995 [Pseudomonadota bacterium]
MKNFSILSFSLLFFTCSSSSLSAASLAVGIPGETPAGNPDGGAVTVLSNMSEGVAGVEDQLWYKGYAGIPGTPASGESFGRSLATGDFNGDGRADLAIGDSQEDVDGKTAAGAVYILYADSRGVLQGTGSQRWHQDIASFPSEAFANEWFGYALAAGDFNNDGYDDLAIAVPRNYYPPPTALADAGGVNIIYGSPQGLGIEGIPAPQILSQGDWGLDGTVEAGDQFGRSLATGDINGDGFDDLAIGTPLENYIGMSSAVIHAGGVSVIYGSQGGLDASGNSIDDQWLSQDPAGSGDEKENNDVFGESLSIADYNGDGFDDLAIGAPGEDSGAGLVHILSGSQAGVIVGYGAAKLLSQGVDGILDEKSDGDSFGTVLASGDFNKDGFADLAVGAPYENFSTTDDGAVHVIYGSGSGIQASNDEFFHQDSLGIPGSSETYDNFGLSLATGDLNDDGYDDLAIGVPREDLGVISGVGAVILLHGSANGMTPDTTHWYQNNSTIMDSGEESDLFGFSLAILPTPPKPFPWPMFLPAMVK